MCATPSLALPEAMARTRSLARFSAKALTSVLWPYLKRYGSSMRYSLVKVTPKRSRFTSVSSSPRSSRARISASSLCTQSAQRSAVSGLGPLSSAGRFAAAARSRGCASAKDKYCRLLEDSAAAPPAAHKEGRMRHKRQRGRFNRLLQGQGRAGRRRTPSIARTKLAR